MQALLASSCLAASCGFAKAQTAPSAGTLFISKSVYAGSASTIQVGQTLPITPSVTAIADGSYPYVFDNDTVDGNFGVTSPILLSALQTADAPGGGLQANGELWTLDVTTATGMTTSFSSKSELALNVATDGKSLTFMGYQAPINAIDISNANTPDHVDPTNTDIQTPANRAVVQYDASGTLAATPVESYSGNNGRAAVLATNVNGSGQSEYLMAGNAGNGSGTEPTFVVNDTGVQEIAPGAAASANTVIGVQQGTPGTSKGFEYGFAVSLLGYPADKSGKDDNFRGLTIHGNTLYVSKGSGGNGIDTVYQVTPPGGGLPTATTASATTISILPGFPTQLAANLTESKKSQEFYPFGLYFATPTILYVADEGPGDSTRDPRAGLQKWVFIGDRWRLAYTLQNGLNLRARYAVPGYPAHVSPATVGLRNIAGHVSGGKATIFAVTSTNSLLGDPGADPNQVVAIVDELNATTLPASEQFNVVQGPAYGVVYRGVAFMPCASATACKAPVAMSLPRG
jgi:hypothetical protein